MYRCEEAYNVLLKLEETTQFFWLREYEEDADRRAAFGHLVEELLQQELPEVFNVFKVRVRNLVIILNRL